MEGFDATIRACKALGLDLSRVPHAVLSLFYTAGIAFGDQNTMTPEQRRVWRESTQTALEKINGHVSMHVAGGLPAHEFVQLPQKRGPGRPRKIVVGLAGVEPATRRL